MRDSSKGRPRKYHCYYFYPDSRLKAISQNRRVYHHGSADSNHPERSNAERAFGSSLHFPVEALKKRREVTYLLMGFHQQNTTISTGHRITYTMENRFVCSLAHQAAANWVGQWCSAEDAADIIRGLINRLQQ
jgi:hypothetical protein